jgi:hypothetical protein
VDEAITLAIGAKPGARVEPRNAVTDAELMASAAQVEPIAAGTDHLDRFQGHGIAIAAHPTLHGAGIAGAIGVDGQAGDANDIACALQHRGRTGRAIGQYHRRAAR